MQSDSLTPYEREIPLFPLQVVLFPGGVLPLHIFEPRYREMVTYCLDTDSEFGVVLINEGTETGDAAGPYRVGTATRILDVSHLPDGRMNIVTAGEYRFEILDVQDELPYLVAQVRLLDDEFALEVAPAVKSLAEESAVLYQTYELLSSRLIFAWQPTEENPEHPLELAYQIGTRLRISLEERQLLLETVQLEELLTREIAILKDENQRLSFRLMARNN
ncbi:ATP-dependent protease [Candidatus Poribacteria bacterium]|nr:MAG: ATP-dependent protease [Candidatus Poribacteria bacterium]